MADVQAETVTTPDPAPSDWSDALGAAFDELEKGDDAQSVDVDAGKDGDVAEKAAGRAENGHSADDEGLEDSGSVTEDDHATDSDGGDDDLDHDGAVTAPDHWSAADKEKFASLPEEHQQWFLETRKAIEANADQKTEAAARANKTLEQLTGIYKPLARDGVDITPEHVIAATQHLASWHQRLRDDPVEGLVTLAQELNEGGRVAGHGQAIMDRLSKALGVSVGASQDEGQADDEYLDPAAARQVRSLEQRNAQLERRLEELEGSVKQTSQQRDEEAKAALQRQIDAFRNEKGDDGKPAHPYFEELADDMAALSKATDERDLAKLYERALWANPTTRKKELERLRQSEQRQRSKERSEAAKKASAASSPRTEHVGGAKDSTDSRQFRSRREQLEHDFDTLSGAA